jgi:hypothetical protein
MGYSEPNLLILAGDEQSLQSKYPNVWDALVSCKHHRDHRSPIAYGRDLVASWVFEDCVIGSLCEGGIDAKHGGSDCDRHILYKDGVTTNSDVKIIVGDSTIPIEIMCDYTGWWTANGRIDLRDNKYIKLKESKSLFLGFSTIDNILIVMDFSKDITYEYFECYTPYGGKPAYSIEIPRDAIYQFEIPLMVDIVKSICSSRST